MSRVERFSPHARRILAVAQLEAESAGSSTIDTPYMLLGMLRVPDSVANRVLQDLRISYDRVLGVVRAAHPTEPTQSRNPELAPETKRLIENALLISRQRGDQQVDSQHFLLSLVKGDDKSIRYLMRQINLEPQVVRNCVERILQEERRDLPATQPFVQDDEPVMEEEEEPVNPQPDSNIRARVLKLVEDGKISAAEAAELLKAMRFAAVPVPESSGFVMLPLDQVSFDDLRQRTVRFVVTDKRSNAVKAEIKLPFERAQDSLFRLLRDLYSGSTGKSAALDGGVDRIEISVE